MIRRLIAIFRGVSLAAVRWERTTIAIARPSEHTSASRPTKRRYGSNSLGHALRARLMGADEALSERTAGVARRVGRRDWRAGEAQLVPTATREQEHRARRVNVMLTPLRCRGMIVWSNARIAVGATLAAWRQSPSASGVGRLVPYRLRQDARRAP